MAIPSVPRRTLGKTGLSVPVIPFGTQGFGNHFGPVSDEVAVALIKHAVSLGVNQFDTARCYGDSMRKLALALNEIPRDQVIITGRVCCHSAAKWGFYGEGRPDYSAERVVADVEEQLSWLGAGYLDGLLIHDPPEIEPRQRLPPGWRRGTLEGALHLKSRGLVRNRGATVASATGCAHTRSTSRRSPPTRWTSCSASATTTWCASPPPSASCPLPRRPAWA